ncbi:hypothetical protein LPJ71_000114 [Coemansia sp. S17]|nr:hypothetical protein LPJ71_000114 [Coemansia sp. S17]
MNAGPPTCQTQLGSVLGGFSLSIGDTTAQHQHVPNTFSHQDRLEQPEKQEEPDVLSVTPVPEPEQPEEPEESEEPGDTPAPEPDRSAPRELCTCYLRSSGVCDLCSAGYRLFQFMISTRTPPVKSPAPTFRSTGFGSRRVPVPLFGDSATAQTASSDGSSGVETAPYNNDSVGCSTPAKRKRATDILSQSDMEEAFHWKEWRPGCLDPYPNAKRGRRQLLLRNASVLNNMAHVPTQQRAHNTFRKRVAALVRHVSTNSGPVTGCLTGDKPSRRWLPGDRPPAARTPPTSSLTATPLVDTTPSGPSQTATLIADISTAAHTLTATSTADTTPVAPPQDIATPEGSTTTPAPSLVAAASTDTTPVTPPQDTAPLAAPPPPGPSQTATSNADTTTAALTQTTAPQLAQRAIGMDVDVPAPHAFAELYPVGQGAIGVGIAHAAGQQQMSNAVDMDIEAPGQDLFVDNGPAVYDSMHAPAPQPANITFGMDVEAPGQHAVAELHPAGQGAVVGDDMRAPVQEQVQGAPGMDVDVPPQHVGAGIGLDPVDQGATTGGLAQAPAPQPANSTPGMDVDATEQNAIAELDRVERDIIPPFADWVVARSARYATLRAYLRKMRQLDRAAPYDIPTREQRRRLRRKWTEANNAAAQQHQQSTLGASTAASTQHAAIDSEAVVGENPASQGAIEDDTVHAPPQQQPGPGIASPADLPRATDGDHKDDGLPDYEDPDDPSTSYYWVEQRRDFLDGPPDTDYDRAIERMFRVLVVDSLEDARMSGVDNVGNLLELVVMPDDFIIRDYQSRHNENEGDYIDLPDAPVDEYDQVAPEYVNARGADVDEYNPVAPAHENAHGEDVDEYDPFNPAY